MTLQQGLASLRVAFARGATPGQASPYEGAITDLRRSGLLATALGSGQQAPEFELQRVDGTMVRLGALLAGGPVVVTFYRGGWCPYCSLQLQAYRAALPEIMALGARLVAVSPQAGRPGSALGFDLLHDRDSQAAQRWGLSYQLSQELQAAYAGSGIVLPEINGSGDWRLPVPATFVVEPCGRVALSYVDVDYRNRLEPAEILATLRSLTQAAPPQEMTT